MKSGSESSRSKHLKHRMLLEMTRLDGDLLDVKLMQIKLAHTAILHTELADEFLSRVTKLGENMDHVMREFLTERRLELHGMERRVLPLSF